MNTITIQRSVLLNVLDHQIKAMAKVDKAHGMPSSPLTRYLVALRERLETADVVVPVEDDLIHYYNCGTSMDDRKSQLLDALSRVGHLTPATSMAVELREPA